MEARILTQVMQYLPVDVSKLSPRHFPSNKVLEEVTNINQLLKDASEYKVVSADCIQKSVAFLPTCHIQGGRRLVTIVENASADQTKSLGPSVLKVAVEFKPSLIEKVVDEKLDEKKEIIPADTRLSMTEVNPSLYPVINNENSIEFAVQVLKRNPLVYTNLPMTQKEVGNY
jgi:hypothetical protein